MPGVRFLYQFSVGDLDFNQPGSNILSVTSQANGDFDKKNLTTTPLREYWRSNGINVEQQIVIQANDPTTVVDTFAILNHNLSNLAVVILEANTVNNFAVPAVRIAMQWNETHMVLNQNFGIGYRYWRVRILDPTNPCGYIQIGRIIAGKSLVIQGDEDITDDISQDPDDMAYMMKTEGFFRAFCERVVVDQLSAEFKRLKSSTGQNANYLAFKQFVNTVRMTYPFLFIADQDDPYFILKWVNFDKMPKFNFALNRYVDISLKFQEVY